MFASDKRLTLGKKVRKIGSECPRRHYTFLNICDKLNENIQAEKT